MTLKNKKYSYPDFAQWLVNGSTHRIDAPELNNLPTHTQKEFENCTRTWEILKNMQQIESFDTDKAWETLTQRFKEDQLIKPETSKIKKVHFNNFWKVAAAILVLIGISTIWMLQNNNNAPVIVTNTQQQALKYILPDGSVVYLNKDAQLSYNADFNTNERKITLTGEAFFDITKNAEKPFIVEGTRSSVKVLGTSFNVTANPQTMEVIVATGKVEVFENQSAQNKIVLLPGEKGNYTNGTFNVTTNQADNYKSWVDHILIFKAANLSHVIADISKAYHCQISLGDSSLSNLLITTTYDDISLPEIVSSLSLALNIDYKKVGDSYILTHR